MAGFLLEIGVEEIPDWMIDPALSSLRDSFSSQAGALNGAIELLDSTPRRLALLATGLDEQLPDATQVIPGPYVSAGERAAQGFAKKNNTLLETLHKQADAKGERYFFTVLKKGESALDLFTRIIPEMISGIPWPKTMYWKDRDVRFIRPIRWIVALFDDKVIPFEIAGVKSGNATRAHRILGAKQPLPVSIANYEQVLRDNHVLVRSLERKSRIESSLGADVEPDADLLKTLINLTEFPTPLRGVFDESYLELPKEILSTVMRHHQRYFSVLKPDGSMAAAFVAVTNTDGDPDGLIRQGNERVLRARFNDARFFWHVDQQKRLEDRVGDLAKVTFQAKLGSYKDKTDRVLALATELAEKSGADSDIVKRAALLAKCDLTTDMVKEFTELQGIVGGLYARAQGEGDGVATAIYSHYKPGSMEDSIPPTLEGQTLSIADKLDTLRACFNIGLIPSGSKDPFALRRAAQGVVKILFDARLPLELDWLVKDNPQLAEFMRERIQFYLRELLEYPYDEVNAALVPPISTLPDLADRLEAIHDIRPTADFEPLAASFRRIRNILKQAQFETAVEPKSDLLSAGAEKQLHGAFLKVRETARNSSSYHDKLASVASLRPDVDLFFDKILVNDPDSAIRQNRLALLHSLLTEFSTIADFSEIVTQGANA